MLPNIFFHVQWKKSKQVWKDTRVSKWVFKFGWTVTLRITHSLFVLICVWAQYSLSGYGGQTSSLAQSSRSQLALSSMTAALPALRLSTEVCGRGTERWRGKRRGRKGGSETRQRANYKSLSPAISPFFTSELQQWLPLLFSLLPTDDPIKSGYKAQRMLTEARPFCALRTKWNQKWSIYC